MLKCVEVCFDEKEEDSGCFGRAIVPSKPRDRSRSPTESIGDLSWVFKIQI